MLHYESSLVRVLRTIFYSLPLTLGIIEEKQKVELNFFDDYIDDSVSKMLYHCYCFHIQPYELRLSSPELKGQSQARSVACDRKV